MSAVLIPAGIYCVATAARRDLAYVPLAATPLVFGIQQGIEGIVWMGLRQQAARLTASASLAFLFFALVFWPAWVPFCAAFIQPSGLRRRGLGAVAMLALGSGLTVFVPMLLRAPDWLHTEIACRSIQYSFETLPWFGAIPHAASQMLYMLVVTTPLVVTVNHRFTAFSILTAAAAAVSHVFYRDAYVSVWCFFAAVLSAYLCYLFWRLPKKRPLSPIGGAPA